MAAPSAMRRSSISSTARCALAVLLFLGIHAGLGPRPGAAQYLYVDTDGDGLHGPGDVLHPSGATTLDFWIRTDAARDGSPSACSAGEAPLTIHSYEILLRATNGVVSWGQFVNRRPDFTTSLGLLTSPAEYHNGFQGPFQLDPGLHLLGSLTVTVVSGTPAIEIADRTDPWPGVYTAFESLCPGADGDYKLKLGVDWSDADGAPFGGAANHPPLLDPPADMSVAEASIAEQILRATDADGHAIEFALVSGPSYATVSTTDAGTGVATGVLTLAPGYSDAGAAEAVVRASDGVGEDVRSIAITVLNLDRPPAMLPVEDMMAAEGVLTAQLVYAADVDSDPLTFTKVAGPMYMTVQTLRPDGDRAIGNVVLVADYSDAGMETGTVGVTDGVMSDSRSFAIMVRNANRPPSLATPEAVGVEEGERLSFEVTALDPDGEIPSLRADALPAGAEFRDGGAGVGSFVWTPGFEQAGDYAIAITAEDPLGATDARGVAVSVRETSQALALAQPLDMSVGEGETAEQTLRAWDAEGRPLTFRLASGPPYASVETVDGGAGLAQGVIRLAPGYFDAGAAAAEVAAQDLVGEARRTVAIMVENRDGPAPDAPPFAPPYPVLATGMTPHTITIADVNRDGRPDLVHSNLGSNSVSVRLGIGGGAFGERMSYPTGSMPHTVAVGDLDRDGVADLAVSNMGGTTIGVLLGLPDGTFAHGAEFEIGGSPMFLGLSDFNRDGILDVAATNRTAGLATILIGRGDGTFGLHTDYAAGDGAHGLAIEDLNADGAPDLVTANPGSGTVSVFLGRGDGTLEPKLDFRTSAPHTVAIGRLDGDGAPDLVIANLDTGTISILLGNGDGTFRDLGEIPTGAGAHAAAIADLDQDGRADVAVANQTAGTLSYFAGRGDGSLGPRVDFPGGAGAHAIRVEDLNQDGAPDLAVSAIFGNTITLFWNRRAGLSGRRPPVAEAGGPYRGVPDVPIEFDGGGSSDPDGDALSFAWSFGDRTNGTGIRPAHTYARDGDFRVSLLVSDGLLAAADSATATVSSSAPARAFLRGGARTLAAGAGDPLVEIRLEAVEGAFHLEDLERGSLALISPGTGSVDRIACVQGKIARDGDTDRNGAPEIAVLFARADVARLFDGITRRRGVAVELEGTLGGGGRVHAAMELIVVGAGRTLDAAVAPNPLNPDAVFTIVTARPGPVTLTIYNASGARVRTLLDRMPLPAGSHEARFDGRGDGGVRLPSGIYLFRVTGPGGASSGRLAIIR